MNAAALGGSDTGAVVVYVTVPDKEAGRKIADHLVENKLAACVNIIPGTCRSHHVPGKYSSLLRGYIRALASP